MPPLVAFGPTLASFWSLWMPFGSIWGCPWASFGSPWAPLASPWTPFGLRLGAIDLPLWHLWPSWGSLGLRAQFGLHFPSKCCSSTAPAHKIKTRGILPRLPRLRRSGVRNRCSDPTSTRTGGQDDGSLHKLPQTIPCCVTVLSIMVIPYHTMTRSCL